MLVQHNKGKCNVMHLSYNNPKYTYYMMSGDIHTRVPLSETIAEKDLGVIVDNKHSVVYMNMWQKQQRKLTTFSTP